MLSTKSDIEKKLTNLQKKNQQCNKVIKLAIKKNRFPKNYNHEIVEILLLVLINSINHKNKKYWQEQLDIYNITSDAFDDYISILTKSVQILTAKIDGKIIESEIDNITSLEKILFNIKEIIKKSKILKKRKLNKLLRKLQKSLQAILEWLYNIWSPLEVLFNEDIVEKNQESLFKQYQLFVEMADKISSRRTTLNNFFLSANSLFLVAIGLLVSSNLIHWTSIVLIVAILFEISWWRLIKYYRELNKAKFEVINKLEEKLPTKGYTIEWHVKKTYKKPGKHTRISFGEMWIPKTLIGVYSVFLVVVLVWTFCNIQTLLTSWFI